MSYEDESAGCPGCGGTFARGGEDALGGVTVRRRFVRIALVVGAGPARPVRGGWERARDGHARATARNAGRLLLLALLACAGRYDVTYDVT
jgi:hypothetical protein